MDKKFNFQKLISGVGIAAIALVGSLIGAPAASAAFTATSAVITTNAAGRPTPTNTVSTATPAAFTDGGTSIGPQNQFWLICESAPSTTSGTGANIAASLFSAQVDCQYAVRNGGQISSSSTLTISDITHKQTPGPAFVRSGLTADTITAVSLHDKFLVKIDQIYDGANSTIVWSVSNAFQINAPTYTVSYDANGGTLGARTSSTQFSFGSSIALLSESSGADKPTRSGYTLAGWSANQNEVPAGALTYSYTPTSNITLYAVWTQPITITLDPNGGVAGTTTTVTQSVAGAIVILPNVSPQAPTKTGATFMGWSTTPGGSAVMMPYVPPVGVTTLYAVWSSQGSQPTPTTWTAFSPTIFEITDLNGGVAPSFSNSSTTAGYKIKVSGFGSIAIRNLNISIRNSNIPPTYFTLPGATMNQPPVTWDPAGTNCGYSAIKVDGVLQNASSSITCSKSYYQSGSDPIQYFSGIFLTNYATSEIELTVAPGTFNSAADVTGYQYRLNLFSQVVNSIGSRALLAYNGSNAPVVVAGQSAQVVRLPEWQNKAINSITKVIDQSGVKLIGGKIKLDGVTANDLKKVTLNGKEISVESLNPDAPVLNIPAGAGTGDLVFTLANGGTWTFQNAVRYVEPIKAGKPMKLFNFDNGSTTVNSYQVAQIAAQTADLMRGSTVECFGYVAKKNANTVARATAQAEAICAEALKINPALKKVITIGVDEIMALQPNRIRVFG